MVSMTTFNGLPHIRMANNRINAPICEALAEEDRDNARQDGIDYTAIVDDAHLRAVDTVTVVRAAIAELVRTGQAEYCGTAAEVDCPICGTPTDEDGRCPQPTRDNP
jgi:hypothetical protein